MTAKAASKNFLRKDEIRKNVLIVIFPLECYCCMFNHFQVTSLYGGMIKNGAQCVLIWYCANNYYKIKGCNFTAAHRGIHIEPNCFIGYTINDYSTSMTMGSTSLSILIM